MKITELLIENSQIDELDLNRIGQALGTGAKKVANVAGAVTGGLRGLGTSFKQGYDAGKAYTSGTSTANPAGASTSAASTQTVSAPAGTSSTPGAPTPPRSSAPAANNPPPTQPQASTAPVPGQEIEMPGTNLKFKYDADWKDSAGNPADPAIQKVLQQLASGVDKASIPRADLNAARRSLGLPAFESKTVGFNSKFLGTTI
jgi:hypothetical protein